MNIASAANGTTSVTMNITPVAMEIDTVTMVTDPVVFLMIISYLLIYWSEMKNLIVNENEVSVTSNATDTFIVD